MLDQLKISLPFLGKDHYKNILINDGRLSAQNSMCGISLDVELDFNFSCDGELLALAMGACDKPCIELGKRLKVSSGAFNSFIDLLPNESHAVVMPQGDKQPVQGDILRVLGVVAQYCNVKSERDALRGVYLDKQRAYACSGTLVLRQDVQCILSGIVIPAEPLKLFTRITQPIEFISTCRGLVFFYFDGGFVFSRLIDVMPPSYDSIIKPPEANHLTKPVSAAISSLRRFANDNRTMRFGRSIQINNTEMTGFDLPEVMLNCDLLAKVLSIADVIDFSQSPVRFSGKGVAGSLAVIR